MEPNVGIVEGDKTKMQSSEYAASLNDALAKLTCNDVEQSEGAHASSQNSSDLINEANSCDDANEHESETANATAKQDVAIAPADPSYVAPGDTRSAYEIAASYFMANGQSLEGLMGEMSSCDEDDDDEDDDDDDDENDLDYSNHLKGTCDCENVTKSRFIVAPGDEREFDEIMAEHLKSNGHILEELIETGEGDSAKEEAGVEVNSTEL